MLECGIAPINIPTLSTFNYVWRKEGLPRQLGCKYSRLGNCPTCTILSTIRMRHALTAEERQLILLRQKEHATLYRYTNMQ